MTRPTAVALLALLGLLTVPAAAADRDRDWYYTGFAGALTTEETSHIATGTLNLTDTGVFGASVGKTLTRLSEDFSLGAEAILARHVGEQDLWEVDGALYLRWDGFPWQRHLRTSFALGTGPSYASRVPPLERKRHGADGSARLTNFVFGELAFGLPSEPDVDLILRYHHRSGIFGLIHGVDDASTTFAAGLKFRF